MKKIIFVLCLITAFQSLNAQLKPPKTNAYFATASMGIGSHISFDLSLTHHNKKGLSTSLSATVASNQTNVPEDYNCFLCWPGEGAGNHLRTISALIGKVWQPKLQFIRYDASLGLSAGTFTRSVNFTKKTRFSSYDYNQETKFLVGIEAKSFLLISILPIWGYYIGARANLNPYNTLLTFDIGMTIGYLRAPIKYKNYHTPSIPYTH